MLVCPGTQCRVTKITQLRRLPIVWRILRVVSWLGPLLDLQAQRMAYVLEAVLQYVFVAGG
jgi:hypothetical protein